MPDRPAARTAVVALGLLAAAGCGGRAGPSTAILDAEAFRRSSPGTDARPQSLGDRPGVLIYDADRPPLAPAYDGAPDVGRERLDGDPADADGGSASAGQVAPQGEPVEGVSPLVAEAVPTAEDRRPTGAIDGAIDGATTRPAVADAPERSGGQYVTLGGVVARVNGRPIFSDEVLALAAPAMEQAAAASTAEQFEPVAAGHLRDALRELIRDELEVAAAQRNLSAQEQAVADGLTAQWRDRQMAAAGGSLALARQRAADAGGDFDDLLRRQNRDYLRQVYYQKKVVPRVQVTAQDMRRYYEQNLAAEFSTPEKLEFRVIKVAGGEAGSPEAAMARARSAHDRLTAGEEFAAVAAEVNDDALLKRTGGDLGLGAIERGSYRVAEVEAAAAALSPGEVSEPIAVGDDVYVTTLIAREGGRTTSFADAQDEIKRRLQLQQFAALQDRTRRRLEADATREVYPDMLTATLDIAKQRYVGG